MNGRRRRTRRTMVLLLVLVVGGLPLAFCTLRRVTPPGGKAPAVDPGFRTVRVSGRVVSLPQGETEIAADANGNVVLVWMDGSPANQDRFTLRSASSRDGGDTFSPPVDVRTGLVLGDPTLLLATDGTAHLGALRKDSRGSYRKLAVVIFRSTDFAATWSGPQVVDDDDAFNDRPWITQLRTGGLVVVYGRRKRLPTGSFDRPVFLSTVSASGATSRPQLLDPAARRIPGTAGGSPRTVVVSGDRIAVGYQDVPLDNAARAGSDTYPAMGYAIISDDGGATFTLPVPFTTQSTGIPDAGGGESVISRPAFIPFPRLTAGGGTISAVWIGTDGSAGHAVYCAGLDAGGRAFSAPVVVARGNAGDLTLPTAATGARGDVHAFWLARGSDGRWAPYYSRSRRSCADFSAPVRVSTVTSAMSRWPGGYMGSAVGGRDVYVAWPVSQRLSSWIYVSYGKDLAGG